MTKHAVRTALYARCMMAQVNDHEQVIQPIRISGPDNRVLPEGYSGARRSGSAGLPPKKPPLPTVKVKKNKSKKSKKAADGGQDKPQRKAKPSIPKQKGVAKRNLPEEAPAHGASAVGVTPEQLAQLATMQVVDIGGDDDD
eukprot:COSAG05_NODE_6132_length_1017_cov_1.066449_1_plen_140_part_10